MNETHRRPREMSVGYTAISIDGDHRGKSGVTRMFHPGIGVARIFAAGMHSGVE